MKIFVILLALVLGMSLLPGCRKDSQINSRIVVTAIGIDAGENGGCHLSIQAVEALKTSGSLVEQEDNATEVYECEGATVAAALGKFVTLMGQDTYILHNRVIAVGLEQAQSLSLQSLIDYFVRNHQGRPVADMVIVRGEAAELLKIPSESFTIPSEKLSLMLEEGNQWGDAVRTRLLDVERAISGMYDAMIPIVRVKNEEDGAENEKKQQIEMDGTACFRDGLYKGEVDSTATRGLLFAQGDLKKCLYDLEMPVFGRLTAEVHVSDTDLKVSEKAGQPVFSFQIRCRAEIEESFSPDNMHLDRLNEIDSLLSSMIKTDVENALDQSIRLHGCDVLGLTRIAMKKAPSMVRGREAFWPEILRTSTFEIHVEASVDKIGAQAID